MDLESVLSFEQQYPLGGLWKEKAIRDHFGFSPAKYFLLLNDALEQAEHRPDWLSKYPQMIRLLQERRQQAWQLLGESGLARAAESEHTGESL